MIRPFQSPIVRLTLLALVLGIAVGLLLPRIFPGVAGGMSDGDMPSTAASPDLAEATLDRVESLRAGSGGEVLALGDDELSSVVRYALPGILPLGVSDPVVKLGGGRLALSARVATAAFPDLPGLEEVAGMLPDTVPVRIEGELRAFGKESLALHVSSVEAAHLPLPDRMIPGILDAMGRRHRDGLPRNALHIPLPGGLASVYVRDDSLMLVADR